MTAATITPQELAARLAGRLCHDVLGKISGLTFGVDLLTEAKDDATRQEAVGMLTSGLRGLNDLVAFYRVAFGRGEEAVDANDVKALAEVLFADLRPTLDWCVVVPSLPAAAARAALHLTEIAAGALASGGVARLSADIDQDMFQIRLEAAGPKVNLRPETLAGLRGEAFVDGLNARWVQAWFLNAIIVQAGGSLTIDEGAEAMGFRVDLPIPGGE